MDINEEPLEEKRITVKRKYTENHPAHTVGKTAKIRNKVIESIKDGKLTKEEFNNILREMTVDSTRWMRRNSSYLNVSEDGISLSKTGKRILNELTPTIKEDDVNEKASAFKIANANAEEIFGEFGIATLSHDELSRVINIKLADKLAKKYGESSFMALTELDMEEVLNKNPTLVIENKQTTMKSQFVFESFEEFKESLNEAFASSILTSILTGKGNKVDKNLAKAFYSTTKLALDKIQDEDIITIDPSLAYKQKQDNTIVFYISDNEKENPYAEDGDNNYNANDIPGGGYLLAVASGDNAFYKNNWKRGLLKTGNNAADSVGISKKYKGWDSTGLYNVKRIADVADRAVVLNLTLLQQKYSTASKKADRDSAKAGAIAFKSDKDFKADNRKRYETILANKASKLPLDKLVSEAIDKMANQIKTGISSGETGRFGDPIIGKSKKGKEVKLRDAASHMSNLLDDYSRYVDYVKQEEESVSKYGNTESWYVKSVKEYAKRTMDKVKQVEDMSYAW